MARYPGMDGIKTGFTGPAGFNLAASVRRDGRRLIAIVLGGRSALTRDARMPALLDAGFRAAPPKRGSSVITADAGAAMDIAAKFSLISPAEAAPEPKSASETPSKSWSIQVGAFRHRRDAKSLAQTLTPQYSAIASDDLRLVTARRIHGRPLMLVRFVGLSYGTAVQACRSLHRHNQDCLVIAAGSR